MAWCLSAWLMVAAASAARADQSGDYSYTVSGALAIPSTLGGYPSQASGIMRSVGSGA